MWPGCSFSDLYHNTFIQKCPSKNELVLLNFTKVMFHSCHAPTDLMDITIYLKPKWDISEGVEQSLPCDLYGYGSEMAVWDNIPDYKWQNDRDYHLPSFHPLAWKMKRDWGFLVQHILVFFFLTEYISGWGDKMREIRTLIASCTVGWSGHILCPLGFLLNHLSVSEQAFKARNRGGLRTRCCQDCNSRG